MPKITAKRDKKRADCMLRKAPKSDVIRALIDEAGPIETGEDLLEWVEASLGRGLGIAQRKP